MKKVMLGFMMVALAGFLLSMTNFDVTGDWPVPDKYKKMKNPQAGKKDVDGIGASLYKTHCKSCHGKDGNAGVKDFDVEVREFTSKEFKAQSDGAVYYKSFVGRDEMPNFEKKIKDEEDRWLLVNYIKSLK